MSQITMRAFLGASDFPFISDFMGRSVIQAQLDEHYLAPSSASPGGEKDRGIPEVYYMENVFPSQQGYKSISYTTTIAAASAGIATFDRIYPVRDSSDNRGFLAITTDSRSFLLSTQTVGWVEVTPPGQNKNTVTVASVTGTSLACYSNYNIFIVDLQNSQLVAAPLLWDTGIASVGMIAISYSNNYLLTTDGFTLYWSSALNPLDMQASLTTGAGSGVPAALTGDIVGLSPLSIGFAIYSTNNIVVTQFSGNAQYPWLFKEASNSAGIASIYNVSQTGDDGSNYAWTTAGLLKVTLLGCTPIFPEATDFLSGKIIETYNSATKTLATSYLTSDMLVRIAYSSSRYILISYGVTTYTHAVVYDLALKRWGKLRKDHAAVFDLSVSPNGAQATYLDLKGTTYEALATKPFNALFKLASTAASPKHIMGMLQKDGTVLTINPDYADYTSASVLFLGKYQLVRNNLTTIQGASVENIDVANTTNFTLSVITSYDGKEPGLALAQPTPSTSGQVRQYNITRTGVNHSLLFEGSFHLVGVLLVMTLNGNR